MVVSLSLVNPGLGGDYYAQEGGFLGNKNSQWTGALAQTLGVRGQVQVEDFDRTLTGATPTGTQLVNKARLQSQQQNAIESGKTPPATRAGLDVTASAPKSVSVQCLVVGDLRLLTAHKEANRQMVQWMEANCAQHLTWQDGRRMKQPTQQLLVAQFQHWISRAQDPQIHTHNVVLNLQHRPDGQWCCLDNSAFFQNRNTLGQIYRDTLAKAVQKLGYEIEVTSDQHRFWELKGFSRPVIEAFSQRSQQIRELAPNDANPIVRSWIASHHDRRKKQSYDIIDLQADWKSRLAELTLEGELNAVQGHRPDALSSLEPAADPAIGSKQSAGQSSQPTQPANDSSSSCDFASPSVRFNWFSDISRATRICDDSRNERTDGVSETPATQSSLPQAVERSDRAENQAVRDDLIDFAKAVAELERVFAPVIDGHPRSETTIEPARPCPVRPLRPTADREMEL